MIQLPENLFDLEKVPFSNSIRRMGLGANNTCHTIFRFLWRTLAVPEFPNRTFYVKNSRPIFIEFANWILRTFECFAQHSIYRRVSFRKKGLPREIENSFEILLGRLRNFAMCDDSIHVLFRFINALISLQDRARDKLQSHTLMWWWEKIFPAEFPPSASSVFSCQHFRT